MSEQVLNAEEIESLRAQLAGDEQSVDPIDLTGKERALRAQLPLFVRYLQTYSDTAAEVLSAALRTKPAFTTDGPDLVGPAEALDALSMLPAVAELRRGEELVGFVGLDAALCAAVVERAFGAPVDLNAAAESDSPSEPRPLTQVEIMTLDPTVDAITGAFASALTNGDAAHLKPVWVLPTLGPDLPAGTEAVMAHRLLVDLGSLQVELTLILTPAVMEISRQPETPAGASEHLARHLMQSHLCVSAVLGRAQVTLRDFVALKPGDVVPLTPGPANLVEVYFEDSLRFVARPTQQDGALALEITAEVS